MPETARENWWFTLRKDDIAYLSMRRCTMKINGSIEGIYGVPFSQFCQPVCSWGKESVC